MSSKKRPTSRRNPSIPKPIVLTTVQAPPMRPLRKAFSRLSIPVREDGREIEIDLNRTYL